MFHTTAAHIAFFMGEATVAAHEADIAWLDSHVTDWETAEQRDRFLSERDFPLDTLEADLGFPSNEDWDAYFEMTYVDPSEMYNQHQCIIRETPDGMGCAECLYS